MLKKLLKICFMLIALNSVGQYKSNLSKDQNGFTYETVENDPSKTRIYTLKNGLKVYLAQNKSEPRIQTYIPVRTGSNNDPEDNTGLAHYLEHMLFKGTSKIGSHDWEKEKVYLKKISDLYEQHKAEKNPEQKKKIYKQIDSISNIASQYAVANEYDKLISSLGATRTNAHTWFDETVYKNNIPSNELERWLMVESERFSQLVLRLFHTELESVYEEFNRAQDNDFRLINYALMENLFPDSHYGTQTTLGTSEHLKNPSFIAIENYFNQYYIPNNMAVILVGDLEFDPTIQLINQYFGQYKKGAEPKQYVAKEKPITKSKTIEVHSPSAERLQFAYRLGGVKTTDAKMLKIMDMLLSNSTAGLIDLNINQQQKAQSASSSPQIMKDYSVHYFSGSPKKNQSLDEVRDLILSEINKIKKGEFDEWMIKAIINDFKLGQERVLENSDALATHMYNSFINELTWNQVCAEISELEKITKADIVKFANDNYKDNFVAIYKRQGENKKLIRVENQGITPVKLNRENESKFYQEFQKIQTSSIEPVYVDFAKAMNQEKINGLEFTSIKNTTNHLAQLYFIAEMGTDHNPKLALAINYLNYLGTTKYSPEEIKKEFFKIGIDYGVSVNPNRSYVYLSGLQENLNQGIALFEHLMSDAVANEDAYINYVEKILKGRKDAKTNKNAIQNALNNYVMYGPNSRYRDIISEEELKSIDPKELISIIKEFFQYNHQIFYYGNDLTQVKQSLIQHHDFGKNKTIPKAKDYAQPETTGLVYFAPYDMVQAEISLRAREVTFDQELLPYTGIFNEYFGSGLSSIVFQEIRESKSLAYSAYSNYSNAGLIGKHNYLAAYIGTQANKLPIAVDALKNLLSNMPKAENQFNNSRNAALKQIASQRYNKSQIFFYWLGLKDRGIDKDFNQQIYEVTRKMSIDDLQNFYDKHVKDKKFNVGLMGKKENLDWTAIEKLGTIKELTLEDLFGY